MGRDEVRQALAALGLQPSEVDARLAQLSDEDLQPARGEPRPGPGGGRRAAVHLDPARHLPRGLDHHHDRLTRGPLPPGSPPDPGAAGGLGLRLSRAAIADAERAGERRSGDPARDVCGGPLRSRQPGARAGRARRVLPGAGAGGRAARAAGARRAVGRHAARGASARLRRRAPHGDAGRPAAGARRGTAGDPDAAAAGRARRAARHLPLRGGGRARSFARAVPAAVRRRQGSLGAAREHRRRLEGDRTRAARRSHPRGNRCRARPSHGAREGATPRGGGGPLPRGAGGPPRLAPRVGGPRQRRRGSRAPRRRGGGVSSRARHRPRRPRRAQQPRLAAARGRRTARGGRRPGGASGDTARAGPLPRPGHARTHPARARALRRGRAHLPGSARSRGARGGDTRRSSRTAWPGLRPAQGVEASAIGAEPRSWTRAFYPYEQTG